MKLERRIGEERVVSNKMPCISKQGLEEDRTERMKSLVLMYNAENTSFAELRILFKFTISINDLCHHAFI